MQHGVTEEVIKEARAHPGGFVYKIEGNFGPDDAVPPHAIVGAWEVDQGGNLTGIFVENPHYRARALHPPGTNQMNTIAATGEYGLVVRRDALRARCIAESLVLQALEVDAPLDMDQDLMSFGPAFGEEALQELVQRLQALGLSPVDDFCTLCLDLPTWCRINVGLER